MELRHIIAAHLRQLHKKACPWSSEERPKRLWLGVYGELVALSYLKSQKVKILRRNFRWQVSGEIDLVAREGDTLVFIEVKTRKNRHFGGPADNVDYEKRNYIRLAAQHWLSMLAPPLPPHRFDIIEIELEAQQAPLINWKKDCFKLQEYQNHAGETSLTTGSTSKL